MRADSPSAKQPMDRADTKNSSEIYDFRGVFSLMNLKGHPYYRINGYLPFSAIHSPRVPNPDQCRRGATWSARGALGIMKTKGRHRSIITVITM